MLTDEIPNKYPIDSVTLNVPDTSDHEFVTDADTIGIKEKKQHICSCGRSLDTDSRYIDTERIETQ